ncbi:MAG: hypothetical protein SFY95_01695 [Planctomycetota bacterium]|nr:hypothetical protein [Planctomycetota bacterium]
MPRRSPQPAPRAARPKPASAQIIHALGDSHVALFSGLAGHQPIWPTRSLDALAGFRTYRLGAFLAHSLTRPGHRAVRALRAALTAIDRERGNAARRDLFLLSFGEIDCRGHVVELSHTLARPIEDLAADLARRYASACAREMRGRSWGFWAPPPPMDTGAIPREYLIAGTLAQRSRAYEAFRAQLHTEARALGVPVIDLVKGSPREGRPRLNLSLFADRIHLGAKALGPALRALERAGWLASAKPYAGAVKAAMHVQQSMDWFVAVRAAEGSAPAWMPAPERVADLLIERAGLECLALGTRTIALFGAGQHTRRIGLKPYRALGLNVTVILDDAASGTIEGVPILRPAALPREVGAVVISSDGHEEALHQAARSQPWAKRVPIVRIYAPRIRR